MVKAELQVVCGNTRIRCQTQEHTRQHLNDRLHGIGVDYTNRPDHWIDVYIDDARLSCLSEVVLWLEHAAN